MALNTRTLDDVITYAKRQFGDESGVQLVDNDVVRAVNQACMEIVSKNKVLRASAQTSLVAKQETYLKPDDCLQVTSLRAGSYLLSYLGFDQYQETVPSCADLKYWTQYGDTLMLGAAPSKSVTNGLTIYYVPEPKKVSAGTDVLPVPDRYFERVCEYVMAKLYEMDEDWEAHNVNRQLFEDKLVQLNEEEANSSGPFLTIGRYDY